MNSNKIQVHSTVKGVKCETEVSMMVLTFLWLIFILHSDMKCCLDYMHNKISIQNKIISNFMFERKDFYFLCSTFPVKNEFGLN